jgi:hypothetical protein
VPICLSAAKETEKNSLIVEFVSHLLKIPCSKLQGIFDLKACARYCGSIDLQQRNPRW